MSQAHRERMIGICQQLDRRQYVANHDGNISIRLGNDRYLATPTARAKADLSPNDLIIVNENGQLLEGTGAIFSEWKIHQALYQMQPDLQCVVHAHPVHATALGLQEKPLLVDYLPEAVVSLGDEIPCVPQTVPLSQEQLQLIKRIAPLCPAFLVCGNGVFAHGHDLQTTYLRIELVEHLCAILKVGGTNMRKLPDELKKECLQKHRQVMERSAAPFRQRQNADEISDLERLVDDVVKRLEQGAHD